MCEPHAPDLKLWGQTQALASCPSAYLRTSGPKLGLVRIALPSSEATSELSEHLNIPQGSRFPNYFSSVCSGLSCYSEPTLLSLWFPRDDELQMRQELPKSTAYFSWPGCQFHNKKLGTLGCGKTGSIAPMLSICASPTVISCSDS